VFCLTRWTLLLSDKVHGSSVQQGGPLLCSTACAIPAFWCWESSKFEATLVDGTLDVAVRLRFGLVALISEVHVSLGIRAAPDSVSSWCLCATFVISIVIFVI
jgi:hypothetical protein